MPDGGPPVSAGGSSNEDPHRSILLTGATGFIGGWIQHRLIEAGWQLRVLARSASPSAGNLDPRAELIDGTLQDTHAAGRGVAGTRAVINCAGTVRGSSYEDFARANVTGVRQLCQAIARLSAPPPLLHLSSLAAEAPDLSDYACSKRDGERVLEEFADLDWTVIRPPAVYGPGDKEMRGALAWARRGIVPVAGGDRRQRLSMLHVDDLAGAVLAWLSNPGAHRHRVYAIHDGKDDGYDWDELATAVAKDPNRKPLFIGLSTGLLNGVATLNEAFGRMTGHAVMLSRGKVRELTHPRWVADNASFTEASGWIPRISLADGVSGLFES